MVSVVAVWWQCGGGMVGGLGVVGPIYDAIRCPECK